MDLSQQNRASICYHVLKKQQVLEVLEVTKETRACDE